MLFYVKESIRVGPRLFAERAVRTSPLKSEEAAIRLMKKSQRQDNFPFIVDGKGIVLHKAEAGKEYGKSTT